MKKRRKHKKIRFFILTLGLIGVCACYVCQKYGVEIDFQPVFEGNVNMPKRFLFADKNDVHLAVAEKFGIKPVESRRVLPYKNLKRVKSCGSYKIARLTHSVPYLTSEAASLLSEIGESFQTELTKNGFRKHRLIVTSMLRTKEDVNRLMKNNINAVSNSAHMYGTTFDISYARFKRVSQKGLPVSNQKMAELLGEVLERVQKEKKCYVKYERAQRCFHITSRH